jgi:hypothetical protein
MDKPQFLGSWVTADNFKSAFKFWIGLSLLIGFYCMEACEWMFKKIGKLYK